MVSRSRPETHFAKLGAARIAYSVFGEGPINLVLNTGLVSNIDSNWDHEGPAEFIRGLAAFSRVVMFDPRGSGASDPIPAAESFGWEAWVDDLRAVLDAAGCDRAAIFAFAEAGPAALLFAATDPQRVSALVLVTTTARYTRAEDYPLGFPPEEADDRAAALAALWGSERFAKMVYPSRAGDPRFIEWFARYQRAAASPGRVEALYARMFRLDARHALALVTAPTLILATENRFIEADHSRYLAEHIAGARLVVHPTTDIANVYSTADPEEVVGIVEEFLTGARRASEPQRKLATVLFTDIVGSTDRAAELGDRKWRRVLDQHDERTREAVSQFGGEFVKSTGDGALATFEGPARAIRCIAALRDGLGGIGIDVRSGLHVGEIELRDRDVGGIAIHIAARVMAEARTGEILASSTVKDLVVGSGIAFVDRGVHTLKGIPDQWRLYAVESV